MTKSRIEEIAKAFIACLSPLIREEREAILRLVEEEFCFRCGKDQPCFCDPCYDE